MDQLITSDLATRCTQLSQEIRRQIGLLINRRGNIETVVVGTDRELMLPPLSRTRSGPRLLRGVRLVHTHLNNQPLTKDDMTDLAILRLDLIAAIGVGVDGNPAHLYGAHILPPNLKGRAYEEWPPAAFSESHLDCGQFIQALESEITRATSHQQIQDDTPHALVVSVSTRSRAEQEERMEETKELACSQGVRVLETIVQRPQHINPKYLLGSGKIRDVIIHALQCGADMLIFDQDLSPTQMKSISDLTEMKVLDRTQLILDIFARRAHTRAGKIQVELAQLQYLLPRLSQTNTAFSRLGGGIGGRGPGETKLETDLRRARNRIRHLENELKALGRHRDQQRQGRTRRNVPVISIVGYTNAGKSTLLNALTGSSVSAKNRPFETLDTVSRRLFLGPGLEAVMTDTVGFLRDLPRDLFEAFRPTMEELRHSDVLLHVVDSGASDPLAQMKAVEGIFAQLHLNHIPRVVVLNKCDQLSREDVTAWCHRCQALGISAVHPETLIPLRQVLASTVFPGSVGAPRSLGFATGLPFNDETGIPQHVAVG